MKNKTTAWTAEEDAVLAQAAKDFVSPTRLCVRLRRSVGSIKRRMRELGLAGTRRGPRRATQSEIQVRMSPIAQVEGWLQACKAGDLQALMALYGEEATLECACTGSAVYAGVAAILEYWVPKLRSTEPRRFTLTNAHVEDKRVVVDYLSYEAKPVRMYLSLDETGKIVQSECGPRECKNSIRDHHTNT